MYKLAIAIFSFVLLSFIGAWAVSAQTDTPNPTDTPTVTPTPTGTQNRTPSGAPRTGYGTMSYSIR